MTDRVRITIEGSGELLHEGPRPREAPALSTPDPVPNRWYHGTPSSHQWRFDQWLKYLQEWEEIAGKPPMLFDDPTNLAFAIGLVERGRHYGYVEPSFAGAALTVAKTMEGKHNQIAHPPGSAWTSYLSGREQDAAIVREIWRSMTVDLQAYLHPIPL